MASLARFATRPRIFSSGSISMPRHCASTFAREEGRGAPLRGMNRNGGGKKLFTTYVAARLPYEQEAPQRRLYRTASLSSMRGYGGFLVFVCRRMGRMFIENQHAMRLEVVISRKSIPRKKIMEWFIKLQSHGRVLVI
jgi:hypothetical protein